MILALYAVSCSPFLLVISSDEKNQRLRKQVANISFGTLTLTDNAFSERCGVNLGSCGRVYSTVQLNANDKKKIKMAKMFDQSDGNDAVAPIKRIVVVISRNVDMQTKFDDSRPEIVAVNKC